ncbi:hypothetical protein J6590_032609 [Homalodisca vitripennis]|nr:hypothetical protein J6590_032609 [Homalodisca vitripennis]
MSGGRLRWKSSSLRFHRWEYLLGAKLLVVAVYDGSLHLCGSTDGSIYLELNYEWWPMYLQLNYEWWPSTMEVFIFAVPQRRWYLTLVLTFY